jgi:hypothetical protein
MLRLRIVVCGFIGAQIGRDEVPRNLWGIVSGFPFFATMIKGCSPKISEEVSTNE